MSKNNIMWIDSFPLAEEIGLGLNASNVSFEEIKDYSNEFGEYIRPVYKNGEQLYAFSFMFLNGVTVKLYDNGKFRNSLRCSFSSSETFKLKGKEINPSIVLMHLDAITKEAFERDYGIETYKYVGFCQTHAKKKVGKKHVLEEIDDPRVWMTIKNEKDKNYYKGNIRIFSQNTKSFEQIGNSVEELRERWDRPALFYGKITISNMFLSIDRGQATLKLDVCSGKRNIIKLLLKDYDTPEEEDDDNILKDALSKGINILGDEDDDNVPQN